MSFYKHKNLFIAISILILILIDQITKYYIYNLHYLNNLFILTLNKWISWWITLFHFDILIFLIPSILILITYLFYKKQISTLAFIFIISWWIWNFIDRIIFHGVRDFIALPPIFGYQFPIFNMADVFVSIWFLIILFEITKNSKKN